MAKFTFLWTFISLLFVFCRLSGAVSMLDEELESHSASDDADGVVHDRSVNTCADPSLATSVYLGFTGGATAHVLSFRWVLANENTKAGSAYWNLQGEVFKAWQAQQPFTVPLFSLAKPDGTDYVALLGTDAATPPLASGFNPAGIIAWVYDSPTCGSIPLYSLANAEFSDHFYTVDESDRDSLIGNGWTDGGIVAYVLPL